MANYMARFRTSYFRVTDESALRELVGKTDAELLEHNSEKNLFAIGNYDTIPEIEVDTSSFDEDCDSENLFLVDEIRKLLPDGEVAVFMEAGHEKLRYIAGDCWVVTNKESRFLDLATWAREQAKELGKEHIQLDY